MTTNDKFFIELINIVSELDNFNFLHQSLAKFYTIVTKNDETAPSEKTSPYSIRIHNPNNHILNKIAKLGEKDNHLFQKLLPNMKLEDYENIENYIKPLSKKARKLFKSININIDHNNYIYNKTGQRIYYDNDIMYEYDKIIRLSTEEKIPPLLKKKLKDAVDSLQQYDRNHKYFKLVKYLIWNDAWKNALIHEIDKLCHKQVLEKIKYKKNALERTTLTSMLGNIFLNFIFSQTSFKSIFSEDPNLKIMDKILEIARNISQGDDINNILCEELCRPDVNMELQLPTKLSEHLLNVLYIYVMANLYIKYEHNLLPPKFILLLKEKEDKAYYYFAELEKLKLKIGSVLYEFMKEQGIFQELELKKFTKSEKKPSYQIDFNSNIYDEICKASNSYKPYLLKEKDYKEKKKKEKSENSINTERFLHDKFDIKRTVNNGTYISKEKPSYKCSIDLRMLVNFLKFLRKIFSMGINENTIKSLIISEDFFIFLSLYDININLIKRLYENDNSLIKDTLIRMLKLAFDFNHYNFNTIENKEIKKKIKSPDIPYEIREELRTLLNKVLNNKIFIIGLLQDCIIYAPFGFFYIGSYVDGRFRLYIEGYYLDFQNFPLARAFVKLHNDTDEAMKEKKFSKYKEIILNNISDYLMENKKNEYYKYMTYDYYKELEKEKKKIFISKYLKEGTVNQIDLIKDNWEEIINFAVKNSKKVKTIIETASYIWHYRKPLLPYAFCTGVDSTLSGPQMISILFQDPVTAKLCNLIGVEKKDLYQIAADQKKNYFLSLLQVQKDIKDYFKIELQKLKNTIKLNWKYQSNNADERINTWINLNISASYNKPELIMSLYDDFKGFPIQKYLPLYKNIEWFYKKLYKKLRVFSLEDKSDFLQFLLILKASFHIYLYTNEGNKNLIDEIFKRKVDKDAIMTKNYNSTSFSRIQSRIEYLLDIFRTHNYPYKRKQIDNLARFLESHFYVFSKDYLQGTQRILDFAKELKTYPLQVNNKYISMTLCPKKYEIQRITVFSLTKSRGSQLSLQILTPDHDTKKMVNSLPANITHSMDASIVHTYNMILHKINKNLNQINLSIGYFTIHDMFWCTEPYLTDIFLQDAYLRFMRKDIYFNYIKETALNKDILDKYRPTKNQIALFQDEKLNPNFAK